MAKVPFTAFFNGPLAVYPIQTGQSDPITGAPYLGTDFLQGNYCDVSGEDVMQWNSQYGTQLQPGRYRICRVAPNAVAANLSPATGDGVPVGWATGPGVGSVIIANAGSSYTAGTFTCASTYNIGSQSPALVSVTVGGGGTILSAVLVSPGGPFVSGAVPTFSLSELSGGSSGSIIAQMQTAQSYITSFDSTAAADISLVRGICYTPLTAAQITAGAWVVIQESGVAQCYVTTATQAVAGDQAIAVVGGGITTRTPAYSALEIGYVLSAVTANTTTPTKLNIPPVVD